MRLKDLLKTWCVVCVLAAATATDAESAPPPAAGRTIPFGFKLKRPALTSAGVYAPDGHLVRTLWTLAEKPAGRQEAAWDGLDEFGQPAPAAAYEYRVVLNRSRYTNVAIIGNTGKPPTEFGHIQHGIIGVTVDPAGRIYTANGWEEGGHDFKVFSPEGATLFHARYQIRNGNPNGAPHAIAVDATHIYCATHGWASEQWKNKMQIQRFRIADGTLEEFTDPALKPLAGHIELYEWPEKKIPAGTAPADAALMRLPVHALAVLGDTIFATDALGGKVHRFHKVTGSSQGDFAVRLPHALAIDAKGRLWVGHEHDRVSLFSPEGNGLGTRLRDQGEIRSLAFGPDGFLYVADGKAGQVRAYDVTADPPKLVRTLGSKATPGDWQPDRFYDLRGAAVDAQGHLVTIATVPTGGTRIARFNPDGTCAWEQLGLMFCDTGAYAPWRPDELLTQRFHRMELGHGAARAAGQWQYRGAVLAGDPKLINWQHGVLRFLKLGDAEFAAQCYGDGMQFYRRDEAGLYHLAAMLGGCNPGPDFQYNDQLPADQRRPLQLWSWADANGNGRTDDDELAYFTPPGTSPRYAVFGINADDRGNLLYCDHHTKAIWELPAPRLNAAGNPLYDWRLRRQVVPPDASPVKFFALMAARAEDGSIYAFGRSDAWPRPDGKEGGYAWMGGWALARYDAAGKMLWATRLPGVSVGMCPIPGGRGVMVGYFKAAHIYHYSADGLLVGRMQPGEAAGNTTGWMDNTSAVAVCRDPRDGILDVFGEDSWLNRMLWYRVDDRDMETVRGQLSVK